MWLRCKTTTAWSGDRSRRTSAYQMLGWIDEDLKQAMGIDVESVPARRTMFGYANENWKPWRMDDGQEILVGGGFEVTRDANGDALAYPETDLSFRTDFARYTLR